MIRLMLALMIGGGFLTFFGYREYKLTAAADAQPQTISAADLLANGPGDNAHVNVTDLFILTSFVYEEKEDKPGVYTKVWVPAVSMQHPTAVEYFTKAAEAELANPENPDYSFEDSIALPENIGLVILTEEVSSDDEFFTFLQNEELQGLVINEIDQLSGEELDILQGSYAGVDPDKLLVLEHNRKPAGMGKVGAMMGGGVLLLLAGPGLLLIGRNK